MLTLSEQYQLHDSGRERPPVLLPVDLSVHGMPARDLALLPGSTTVFLQTLAWYLAESPVRCTELCP